MRHNNSLPTTNEALIHPFSKWLWWFLYAVSKLTCLLDNLPPLVHRYHCKTPILTVSLCNLLCTPLFACVRFSLSWAHFLLSFTLRQGSNGRTCSGRGRCDCGLCSCEPPPVLDQYNITDGAGNSQTIYVTQDVSLSTGEIKLVWYKKCHSMEGYFWNTLLSD